MAKPMALCRSRRNTPTTYAMPGARLASATSKRTLVMIGRRTRFTYRVDSTSVARNVIALERARRGVLVEDSSTAPEQRVTYRLYKRVSVGCARVTHRR